MKRIASWGVALAGSIVFFVAETAVVTLAFVLAEAIMHFSEVLFWLLVIFEGATLLLLAVFGILSASKLVVSLSQRVWKSHHGGRYKIFGALMIIWFVLNSILVLFRFVHLANAFENVIIWLVAIGYGIALIYNGITSSAEDGPPPTRKERLAAEINKIDEKERRELAAMNIRTLTNELRRVESERNERLKVLAESYTDDQLERLVANGAFMRDQADTYAEKRNNTLKDANDLAVRKEELRSKIADEKRKAGVKDGQNP